MSKSTLVTSYQEVQTTIFDSYYTEGPAPNRTYTAVTVPLCLFTSPYRNFSWLQPKDMEPSIEESYYVRTNRLMDKIRSLTEEVMLQQPQNFFSPKEADIYCRWSKKYVKLLSHDPSTIISHLKGTLLYKLMGVDSTSSRSVAELKKSLEPWKGRYCNNRVPVLEEHISILANRAMNHRIYIPKERAGNLVFFELRRNNYLKQIGHVLECWFKNPGSKIKYNERCSKYLNQYIRWLAENGRFEYLPRDFHENAVPQLLHAAREGTFGSCQRANGSGESSRKRRASHISGP